MPTGLGAAIRVASLAVLLVAAGASPGLGAALEETPKLVFVAPAWVLEPDSPLRQGKPADAAIEVTLTGVLWPPSHQDVVSDEPWRWPPDPGVVEIDSMLANLRAAVLSGDVERIALAHVPEERPAARARYADPGELVRAQREAGLEGPMTAYGFADYREYVLALVTVETGGETLRRVLVFAERPGEGWLRTDALASDPTFEVVAAAWREARYDASVVTMIPSDFDPFPPE